MYQIRWVLACVVLLVGGLFWALPPQPAEAVHASPLSQAPLQSGYALDDSPAILSGVLHSTRQLPVLPQTGAPSHLDLLGYQFIATSATPLLGRQDARDPSSWILSLPLLC